jgi:hypothetical protein
VVGKLESLMVDQCEDAVFRAKKTIETGVGHKNLLISISCVQRGVPLSVVENRPELLAVGAGPVDG